MPFTDLNNVHFTPQEQTNVHAALQTIEDIIFPKSKNLTPEERKKYGSVNEQNKLFVNKDHDYHVNQPALQAPDVDWVEFDKDFASRAFNEGAMQRLDAIGLAMKDTKTLHDFDNYSNALIDYDYTGYKANKTNDPAYEAKYNELKQFFPNTGGEEQPV